MKKKKKKNSELKNISGGIKEITTTRSGRDTNIDYIHNINEISIVNKHKGFF